MTRITENILEKKEYGLQAKSSKITWKGGMRLSWLGSLKGN